VPGVPTATLIFSGEIIKGSAMPATSWQISGVVDDGVNTRVVDIVGVEGGMVGAVMVGVSVTGGATVSVTGGETVVGVNRVVPDTMVVVPDTRVVTEPVLTVDTVGVDAVCGGVVRVTTVEPVPVAWETVEPVPVGWETVVPETVVWVTIEPVGVAPVTGVVTVEISSANIV